MRIKNLNDVPRVESEMTESETQVAVACKWLNHGYNSILGGDKLAKWLEEHIDKVESAFGADDRVYIKLKDKNSNAELAQFIIKEEIGDEVMWKKFANSDRWWLYVWWD